LLQLRKYLLKLKFHQGSTKHQDTVPTIDTAPHHKTLGHIANNLGQQKRVPVLDRFKLRLYVRLSGQELPGHLENLGNRLRQNDALETLRLPGLKMDLKLSSMLV